MGRTHSCDYATQHMEIISIQFNSKKFQFKVDSISNNIYNIKHNKKEDNENENDVLTNKLVIRLP